MSSKENNAGRNVIKNKILSKTFDKIVTATRKYDFQFHSSIKRELRTPITYYQILNFNLYENVENTSMNQRCKIIIVIMLLLFRYIFF